MHTYIIYTHFGIHQLIESKCFNIMPFLFTSSYSSGPPRFGGSRNGPPQGKKFGNPGDRLRKKHWNLDELPKFEKNFYQEHHEVSRRSPVSKRSIVGCDNIYIYIFFPHQLEILKMWLVVFFYYCSKTLNTTGEPKRSQ